MATHSLRLSAALLAFLVPVCSGAKVITYEASGSFANGTTLGGTIGIDSGTGQVDSTALLTTSSGAFFDESGAFSGCIGVSVPCSVIEASNPDYLLRLFAAAPDLTGGGTIPLYTSTNLPNASTISSIEGFHPQSFSDLSQGALTQVVGSTAAAIAEPSSLQALAAALIALAVSATPLRRRPRRRSTHR